jgi:hypothetical protein
MAITNAPAIIRSSYSTSSAIWNAALCVPANVHSADVWHGVLKPVVARYLGKVARIYFRADAGFANPEVYEFLEAERIKYVVRLPANSVLQGRIGYLLARPVGRPPNEVRRYYANFTYQAGSWTIPRRAIIKIGAKVVSHGRYIAFQMALVAIPRNLFGDILRLIAKLRPPPDHAPG